MAKQSKPQSFTLDRPGLVKMVEEAEAVKKAIGEAAGTMGAIMGKASATVETQSVPADLMPDLETVGETWAERIAAAQGYLEMVQARFNEAVKEAAGGHITTHKTSTAALTARYEKLAEQAEAMHKLLSSAGVDVSDVTVPAVKLSAKSSGGGKGLGQKRNGGVPTVEYFKVEDGKTVILASDHRSKLGSIAFYWYGKCGVGALRAALEAAGVTDPSQPFEAVSVTAGGVTHLFGGRAPVA